MAAKTLKMIIKHVKGSFMGVFSALSTSFISLSLPISEIICIAIIFIPTIVRISLISYIFKFFLALVKSDPDWSSFILFIILVHNNINAKTNISLNRF